MNNIKIYNSFIELLKSNGKRFLCTLVTMLMIAIPHTGKTEEKTNDYNNQTKIVQQDKKENKEIEVEVVVNNETIKTNIDLNNPTTIEDISELVNNDEVSEYSSFTLYTHWEKSENYDNNHREYKRSVYKFVANENFDASKFNNDTEKIVKYFRDDENSSEIFDIIESYEDIVTVSYEDEKNVETDKDTVVVDGTNLVLKINTKDYDEMINLRFRMRLLTVLLIYCLNASIIIKKTKHKY